MSNKYHKLMYDCMAQNFPIPPTFEEKGWELIHHKDKKLCQLHTCHGFKVWMGNGHNEVYDMAYGAARMHGHCLVLGLGIGLVVQMIDYLNICTKVTIVEHSPTVIKNIFPWLESVTSIPLEVIESDDIDFLTNTKDKFNTMYADTWEKCTDALEKIKQLKALSKDIVKGKKVYWAEQELKAHKKREYNSYY